MTLSPPPVIILDGLGNALCLSRCFGEKNIPVFISTQPKSLATYSKYCTKSYPVPANQQAQDYWKYLLLSGKHPELKGGVLMVCSDIAVEFVAHHKQELSDYYLVDEHIPELHLDMLDKQKTLELGSAAGCPIPAFYNIDTIDDVKKILDKVMFPAMVKPIHSHLFQQHFERKKYLIANNKEELQVRRIENF